MSNRTSLGGKWFGGRVRSLLVVLFVGTLLGANGCHVQESIIAEADSPNVDMAQVRTAVDDVEGVLVREMRAIEPDDYGDHGRTLIRFDLPDLLAGGFVRTNDTRERIHVGVLANHRPDAELRRRWKAMSEELRRIVDGTHPSTGTWSVRQTDVACGTGLASTVLLIPAGTIIGGAWWIAHRSELRKRRRPRFDQPDGDR